MFLLPDHGPQYSGNDGLNQPKTPPLRVNTGVRPAAPTINITPDRQGRITRGVTTEDYGTASTIADFTYEYVPNTNNIANIAYNHRGDSNEVDYSYDDLDRLTLAEYNITDESNEAFTIDDLGNRDLVNVRDGSNVDYVIDANTNRYDSVEGSRPQFEGYLPRSIKNVPHTNGVS